MARETPEYLAFIETVKNGHAQEIEQHLADHPEFLDLPNGRGNRPLHYAAMNGRNPTVELLLKHGSTALDSPTNDGMTPLHYAAMNGHNSMIELLLSYEPPFDPRDFLGLTPLHWAVIYERDSMAKILKAVGANTCPYGIANPEQIAMLQAALSEDEILEIRFRIYFSRSLLSSLLF